jgi:hypothetical protein
MFDTMHAKLISIFPMPTTGFQNIPFFYDRALRDGTSIVLVFIVRKKKAVSAVSQPFTNVIAAAAQSEESFLSIAGRHE